MADVFVSYARSSAKQAQQVAEGLRGLGYSVWIDDELPAHRTYARVIEEQITAAKAAVVIWSADAVQSQWVLSEANRAREGRKLVQVATDKTRLPMPFDTIQCADLAGWTGAPAAPGWRKVVASINDLMGGSPEAPTAIKPLPLPDKPSIAVMPFTNLSGDPEQAYFADGMVEEIVGALSRYKSIFVIGSGSTFSFKDKTVSLRNVGSQLGVRYVLEGSVRKAGARVRIAVKLTDAADGAQIWADRFEDTLEDLFALQDTVALAVAGVIEPTVREAEIRRASRRPTENPGSYDLYLRAHGTATSPGPADYFPVAIDLLNQAISLDPNFGPALAMAAGLHAVLAVNSGIDVSEAHREKSGALMHRALQVAGDDPSVMATVAGAAIILGRDTASIEPMIDRALALNPGDAASWYESGRLRVAMGEPDLAVEHLETAIRLDPLSASRFEVLAEFGAARLLQRRFDEAIPLLQQTIELRPRFFPAYAWLAAAFGHLGRLEEAGDALAKFHSARIGTPEEFAQRRHRTPASRSLFLEGIALAGGTSSSSAA